MEHAQLNAPKKDVRIQGVNLQYYLNNKAAPRAHNFVATLVRCYVLFLVPRVSRVEYLSTSCEDSTTGTKHL